MSLNALPELMLCHGYAFYNLPSLVVDKYIVANAHGPSPIQERRSPSHSAYDGYASSDVRELAA